MLRLHAKYSGRLDSYVPSDKRTGTSASKEYRESRIGDACFYLEKVLDRICEFDPACRQSVDTCRKQLWPGYHKLEAMKDEEEERREAEAKKKRAKVGGEHGVSLKSVIFIHANFFVRSARGK